MVVSSSSAKSNISSEISSVSDWLGALTSIGALTSTRSTTGSATDGVAAVANVAASAWSSNSSSKSNDAISVASSLATGTEVAASEVRLLDALVSDASKLKAASAVTSLIGVTAGSAFNSKSKSKSSAILLSALGAAVGVVIIGSTAVAVGVDCVSGKLKSKSKSLSLIASLLTLLAKVVVTGSSVTGATISVGDASAGTISAVAGCLLGRSKSRSSKVNSFDCDCAAVVSVVGSVAGGTGTTGAILVSGTSSAKSKSNSLSAWLLTRLARVAGCATSVTLGMTTCKVLLMAGLSLSCLKPGKSKSSPSDSTASAVWVIAALRAFIDCSSSTSIFRLLAWVVRSASLSANTSE